MIDWGAGYKSTWRVFRLDPEVWAESSQVARVESAEVERTRDELLESGSMTVTRNVGEGFEAGYYRIVMTAEQEGAIERVEVATLYCESYEGEVSGGADAVEVECRSVLYPASVRTLPEGYAYVPKGGDGAAYAAALLRECIAAPVSVEGSFALGVDLVHDLDATCLDAARQALDAGGFCMQVDGGGTVHILPLPGEAALDLSRANARMVVPGVSHGFDTSDVPNRYIADDEGVTAVAVNDDEASEVSTVRRGFYHDLYDDSPAPLDGETLPEYARRKLAEASLVGDTRSYTREFWPGVYPGSLVSCSLPEAGLDGDLRVARQELELSYGIAVTEEAQKEVALWQA